MKVRIEKCASVKEKETWRLRDAPHGVLLRPIDPGMAMWRYFRQGHGAIEFIADTGNISEVYAPSARMDLDVEAVYNERIVIEGEPEDPKGASR